MKFSRLHLRVGRVTVEAPVDEGVTTESLGEAIRLALVHRLQSHTAESPGAHHRFGQPGSLGDLIATRIAGGIESAGGGNGRR